MENMDLLYIIKMFIIGIVQGFTEPIPISSSGHVMIVSEILHIGEQGFTFAILTNTASLLAILYVYRHDIARLTVHSLSYIRTREKAYQSDFRFVLLLIIATIPAGVLGVILKDYIADVANLFMIGLMLLITGMALWLIRNMNGKKDEQDITIKDAIIVGFGQAVALFPGISRSGSTIISAVAVGMNRETALRFSFMLYIPVSVGGLILGVTDFLEEPNKSELILPYGVAFFSTLFMTFFSLKWFINIMKKGKLIYFVYYCFTVGSILVLTQLV
ncbi:undecaprenyl-diphosphate phosphatase [Pseudogracilibacillus sp. ICA-222130]|uniref:undecaprenyl-diphosphate phosphatase n=1 Tax=Pseudogracilibacillus sp. ICA-222130 TaxID=3134655 RepID=UPI0030BC27B5